MAIVWEGVLAHLNSAVAAATVTSIDSNHIRYETVNHLSYFLFLISISISISMRYDFSFQWFNNSQRIEGQPQMGPKQNRKNIFDSYN